MPGIEDTTAEFIKTNGSKIVSAMNEALAEIHPEGEWRIRNLVMASGQREGDGHWEKVEGGWIYWK